MRLHYVSPSVLPSRTANATHVVLQCDALSRAGAHVTLYCKRSLPDKSALPAALVAAYGVDASGWRLTSYHTSIDRADSLGIAALAVADINTTRRPDAVLSRNLYAAFALGVVQRHPLIYEIHDLELGIRRRIQKAIITRPWITTVAISQALVRHVGLHHGVAPTRAVVLHDAAPSGMQRVPPGQRRARLTAMVPQARGDWQAVCAYFGQLYPGRGIEIIEAMADARPRVLFLVWGGNEDDIARQRAANTRRNVAYLGHVPHPVAREAMVVADVLLMPYQANVSIGVDKRDTAAWMSPIKMFEYLASGVPIISSDLPVLREVLHDDRNALLAIPQDPASWVGALDRLLSNPHLAARLGETAHQEYQSQHSWDRRASELLAIAERF